MGMNTTLLILNDHVDKIERYPIDFAQTLVRMIAGGQTGEVMTGIYIVESHHADNYVTIKVGGNRAVVEEVSWDKKKGG